MRCVVQAAAAVLTANTLLCSCVYPCVPVSQTFVSWAAKRCTDAEFINTSSNIQIQQLLFGDQKDGACINRGQICSFLFAVHR